MYAIHHDPKVWGEDHHEFKPSRFLSQDGNRFVKNENLIPFGFGRRSCPAEFMASTEVFIYMTSLVQRYKIEQVKNKGQTIEAEMNAFSLVPKDGLRLKFIPRHSIFS